MKGQKLTAVKMVYLEGKKYKDAANEMGISVNSLKTHLKSALKMLRLGLKEKNH
jgi:RNA polymerase sigma-70 factor (ECF subfamily)